MSTDSPLRNLLIAAAREFNAGRYFEAHEVLEEGLEEVPDELWALFLGLIQIAVGYHKASQGLFSGAARMLEIGLDKVEPFPARAAGLDLEAVRVRARRDLLSLRESRFDPSELARRPPRFQLATRDRSPAGTKRS